MIGRGVEAARVEAVIAAARSGESGSLLVSGEPGIGKSLLLEHARSSSDGMRVLEAESMDIRRYTG